MSRHTALFTVAMLLTFMSTYVIDTTASAEPPALSTAAAHKVKAKTKQSARKHKRKSKSAGKSAKKSAHQRKQQQ